MILIKKLQQGGQFTPTKLTTGSFDRSTVLLNNTPKPSNRPASSAAPASTSNTAAAVSKSTVGALQSDLLAYNAEKDKLNTELNDLLDQGISTSSPTYQTALEARYRLDATVLPSLKAKAKAYHTAASAVKTHNAAGAPAIMNRNAMVFNNSTKEYEVISTDTLLQDPKNYSISNIGTAMTQRASNVKFTGELGNFVDSLMNNAFGQQQFNKSLETSVMGLGYSIDSNKNLIDDNNNIFDIDGLGFTNGKLDGVTQQGVNFIQGLSNNASTAQSNYAAGVALQQLHTKLIRDDSSLDLDNLDKELQDLRSTYIFKQGKAVLKRKLKYEGTPGSNPGTSNRQHNNEGGIAANKDVTLNNVHIAGASLGNEKIETITGIESTNAYYSVPSRKVDRGRELIERSWSDKINKEGEYVEPHSFANNIFLTNIPSSSLSKCLTNAAGELIVNYTDSKSLDSITTTGDTNLRLIVAPMIKREDGTKVVNFASKHNIKILEGIAKSNEILAKYNISQEDIEAGTNEEKLAKAKLEIDALSIDIQGGEPITFGLAFALDIVFAGTRNAHDNIYFTRAKHLAGYLENNLSEDVETFDKRTTITKAFIPLGDAYWKASFSKSENIAVEFHSSQWEASKRSAVDISDQDNETFTKEAAASTTYKEGGKLSSNDSIYQLLH